MRINFRGIQIELLNGDIALQKVDGIVNAANSRLAGGGGVDGAIHRRGGPTIIAETDRLYPNGCPTGSAVISGAGKLDATFILHTVAPRCSSITPETKALLTDAYRSSLSLAAQNECRSLAFPSLGTGAYGWPLDIGAKIALETVRDFIERGAGPLVEIRFVLYGEEPLRVFESAAREIFS